MGKIGFVTVSHPDYLDQTVRQCSALAAEGLRKRGIEVYMPQDILTTRKAAEQAGTQLLAENVDGVILFLGSWIECPVAMSLLREVEHLPLLLWGFPMMEMNGQLMSTGSYVTYAMLKGVLERAGYSFKGILSPIENDRIMEEVLNFCIAAETYQRLKRCKVGLVGYTSMSIYTGTFDHLLMRVKIGPEIEHVDAYSLIKIAETMDAGKIGGIIEKLRSKTSIDSSVTQADLDKIARLYYALMELKVQRELDAVNVKCQYEFTKEYGMAMCVPLSLAAEEGVVASCEGDILNTVSMLILHYLSGQVIAYGDAIHHSGNIWKLSPCGFMPFSLGNAGTQSIQSFTVPGFSGAHASFVMRPGRVTVMRLIEDVGDYHLLYMTGQGRKTEKRGGCFPALDVEPDGDINRLVSNYAGQHYAICYGDMSDRLEDLARILKIKAVRV